MEYEVIRDSGLHFQELNQMICVPSTVVLMCTIE